MAGWQVAPLQELALSSCAFPHCPPCPHPLGPTVSLKRACTPAPWWLMAPGDCCLLATGFSSSCSADPTTLRLATPN